MSNTDPPPTVPRPNRMFPARHWTAIVLGAILLTLVLYVLASQHHDELSPLSPLPNRILFLSYNHWANNISFSSLDITANLFGIEPDRSGDIIRINGTAYAINGDFMNNTQGPLLAAILALGALWAGYIWRFGWVRWPLIVLLGLAGGIILLPVFNGIFLFISLYMLPGRFEDLLLMFHYASFMAATAVVVGLWFCIRWVIAQDVVPAPPSYQSLSRIQPPLLWIVALVCVPPAVWLSLARGVRASYPHFFWWPLEPWHAPLTFWRIGIVATIGVLLGAVLLLGHSLFRYSRAARWAWLPFLLLMPWGGDGIVGATLMLALALAGNDPWVAARAGGKLPATTWDRIATRASRPLEALTLLAVSAALCGSLLIVTLSDQLALTCYSFFPSFVWTLSNPLIFWPAACLGLGLGAWELWAHRVPGRGLRGLPTAGLLTVCVGLLALATMGVYLLVYRPPPPPPQSDAYFQRVADAAVANPAQFGPWISMDIPLPLAAITMLHPNISISRKYNNIQTGQQATLLLEQCNDARNLMGHYPPISYQSSGYRQVSAVSKDWLVEGLAIQGMVYTFTATRPDDQSSMMIYNFMILPNGRTCRDMDGINALSRDPRQRVFGAAQMQVIFDPAMPEAQRETLFLTLVQAYRKIIDVILAGEP